MAIISDKPYKLDFYNVKLGNLFFNCSKSEKNCKTMAGKLVFYDRDEILDMHARSLSKGEPYDVSKLEKLQFLDKGEVVDRVVPLERFWLAVLLKTKKTNEAIMNKIMYISPNGEGYVSDEIEPAFNGFVPEEVYLKDASEVPMASSWLDDRYKDGTHDEFMKKYACVSRAFVEKVLEGLIKSDDFKISNSELKEKEKITIEDVCNAVRTEYKRKQHSEDFSTYEVLDYLLASLGASDVLDLCEKYCGNSDEEKTQNS